jgi:hypothetical protein
MERGMKRQPGHENRHEVRIIRAVEMAHVTDEQRPFYVIFARELDLTFWLRPHRKSRAARRRPIAEWQDPKCYAATWDEDAADVVLPTSPDFSSWTKDVVMKWFYRGLSGHKMWLIGKELLESHDSGEAFREWQE